MSVSEERLGRWAGLWCRALGSGEALGSLFPPLAHSGLSARNSLQFLVASNREAALSTLGKGGISWLSIGLQSAYGSFQRPRRPHVLGVQASLVRALLWLQSP